MGLDVKIWKLEEHERELNKQELIDMIEKNDTKEHWYLSDYSCLFILSDLLELDEDYFIRKDYGYYRLDGKLNGYLIYVSC